MENRELIALLVILAMALGLAALAIHKVRARRKFALRQQGRGKCAEVSPLPSAE
jgi:hypothetical protein